MNGLYISGRGGSLNKGLGKWLHDEYNFSVFALNNEFFKQDFKVQLLQIRESLKGKRDIVANSYGAYLFIFSHVIDNDFTGDVIFTSPVLGTGILNKIGMVPKGNSVLRRFLGNHQSTLLFNKMFVIYGDNDGHVNTNNLKTLLLKVKNSEGIICENGAHDLPKEFIQLHLKRIFEKIM